MGCSRANVPTRDGAMPCRISRSEKRRCRVGVFLILRNGQINKAVWAYSVYQPQNAYESIPRPGYAYHDFQHGNEKHSHNYRSSNNNTHFTYTTPTRDAEQATHTHVQIDGRKNSHTHSYSRERGTPRYEGRPRSDSGVPQYTRTAPVRIVGYPTPTRTAQMCFFFVCAPQRGCRATCMVFSGTRSPFRFKFHAIP